MTIIKAACNLDDLLVFNMWVYVGGFLLSKKVSNSSALYVASLKSHRCNLSVIFMRARGDTFFFIQLKFFGFFYVSTRSANSSKDIDDELVSHSTEHNNEMQLLIRFYVDYRFLRKSLFLFTFEYAKIKWICNTRAHCVLIIIVHH